MATQISAQEIELAIALAEKVLSLLNGGKTAAQVAQEINDQTLANDRWLRDHGFFPAEHGGVTVPIDTLDDIGLDQAPHDKFEDWPQVYVKHHNGGAVLHLCPQCSALVNDPLRHRAWHQGLLVDRNVPLEVLPQ